jgi:cytoskeletal protein CcmA (bactofilin family)
VGEDLEVFGDLKSGGGIRVGKSLRVEGSVIASILCERSIEVGENVEVKGGISTREGIYVGGSLKAGWISARRIAARRIETRWIRGEIGNGRIIQIKFGGIKSKILRLIKSVLLKK